jgi:T4-like virus tail tube protein gp19
MLKSIPAFTRVAMVALVTFVLEVPAQRSFTSSRFFLELEGHNPSFLRSMFGGTVTAEVKEMAQAGQSADKKLGQTIYEPFQVQFGLGASDPELDRWIASSWGGNLQPKNGAVIGVDYQYETRFRREFYNALITETTIPACDAQNREAGYLAVKFKPEFTRQFKVSGKLPSPDNRTQQKAWSPANFRLMIDGLDCTRISRIESFTVKHVMPEEPTGEFREYQGLPSKIEFPNLKITLSTASVQTWQDWLESFVVQGKNSSQHERKGRLEFLSANQRDVLATIEFTGLGIFRLDANPLDSNSDAAFRTTADLYCEGMKFIPGDAAGK